MNFFVFIIFIECFISSISCNVQLPNEEYHLTGFEKYESVPIQFPKDICIFKIDQIKFAACLHYENEGDVELNGNYAEVYKRSTPLVVDMDCISMGSKGYVALSYNFSETAKDITSGAPVFEVTTDEISAVQFFVAPYQNSVYLRSHSDKLYLIQTHLSPNSLDSSSHCPFYEWSGLHFNYMDTIPCENAKQIEPFIVDDTAYILVASFANYGNEQQETTSHLYKYIHDQRRFVEHQKFRTTETVEIKYFSIENRENMQEHFFIMANGINREATNSPAADMGTPSVVYKYEKGIFVPIQQIYFHNVTGFLPIYNTIDKFVLLVARKHQDTKFLRYNGRQLEISTIQLTEGALSKGVASMRPFKELNSTYIVIANERMLMNATNIYLPIYKVKENPVDVKLELLNRFNALYQKLINDTTSYRIRMIEAIIQDFRQGIGYFKNANISEGVAKMVINPQYNMTKQYWQKLTNATELIAKIEQRLDMMSDSKAPENDTGTCTYDTLKLNSLTIKDHLEFDTLNNKSLDHLTLDKITADEIIVKGAYQIKNTTHNNLFETLGMTNVNRSARDADFNELRAKQIIVSGTVNGLNFSEFQNRILRKTGDQIITASYNFTKLNVTELQVTDQINGENPAKLIATNTGNFVIDQDLVFTETPEVNQLVINDRLNHINVLDGKLEVLYKDSDDVLDIVGRKTFENVRLLEPFELRGRIHSPHLDKINPVAIISSDLSLEGDYEISGDVLVSNEMLATNYYGRSSKRNILEVFENALSVDTTEIHQTMNFELPITANNVKTAFLNNVNTTDFVLSDDNKEQIITGTKTFKNDVHVSKGSCQVQNVNGINIKDLHENRLQVYGDQTIEGRFQFKSIQVPSINSKTKVTLNKTDIDDILTKSTEQNLAEVTIKNLTTTKIKAALFNTTKTIFNNDIDYLIKDTVLTGSSAEITGYKIFKGNVTTRELGIQNKINQHPLKDFKQSLEDLNEDDKPIEGDMIFDDDVEVESITFEGEINGIPASKFGSSWLLIEGDQNFTAPQEFDVLDSENVFSSGRVNNYSVIDILSNVYWLDQEQFFPNITFANVIAERDLKTRGLINGLNFAESVLLRKSSTTQKIEAPVTCEGHFKTTGHIKDLTIFNNIDLTKLRDILSGQSKEAKLTVDSAIFENYPEFRLLNGHDLRDMMNKVWFADRDTIFEGDITFDDIELQSHVKLNGPLNGVDLNYLSRFYFSLTEAQSVTTPLIFKESVTFEDSLSSPSMVLNGVLVDSESKRSLNFTNFIMNTFRIDINQQITAEWKILTAVVKGDLNKVLVNGLNVFNDVLRHDVTSIQNITAPKSFTTLNIGDLECAQHARINDIDMLDWITNAVYLRGNYTIQGNITIDNIMLYEGINVFGTVNGIKFDEENLLLVDTNQTIHGNVLLRTKFEKMNRIVPLSIEHLNVKTINDINADEFFSSVIPYTEQLEMYGSFVFKTMPIVKHFTSNRGLFGTENSTESPAYFVNRVIADHKILEESFKEEAAYLSHYVLRQTVPGKTHRLVQLRVLNESQQDEDLIAVLRGDTNLYITFHKWDKDRQSFNLANESFSWHSNDSTIVDIDKIVVQDADILVVKTFSENLYSKHFITSTRLGLQMILELSSNQSEAVTPVQYKGQQCFLFHTSYFNNLALQCTKLNENGKIDASKELVIYTKEVVLQAFALKESQFVVTAPYGIDIWDLNVQMTPLGLIQIPNPRLVAYGHFGVDSFLAVVVGGGGVEIFRSTKGSMYAHIQSIKEYNVVELKFSTILESQDLLLYILTTDLSVPFSGYAYRGVAGFQKFFKPINFKPATRFDLISLKQPSKHFISYAAANGLQILEAIIPKV